MGMELDCPWAMLGGVAKPMICRCYWMAPPETKTLTCKTIHNQTPPMLYIVPRRGGQNEEMGVIDRMALALRLVPGTASDTILVYFPTCSYTFLWTPAYSNLSTEIEVPVSTIMVNKYSGITIPLLREEACHLSYKPRCRGCEHVNGDLLSW